MGKHNEHLPRRKHLNKAVGGPGVDNGGTDSKRLEQAARGQGKGTKADAKKAKKGDRT
jgi:hypothetical protein